MLQGVTPNGVSFKETGQGRFTVFPLNKVHLREDVSAAKRWLRENMQGKGFSVVWSDSYRYGINPDAVHTKVVRENQRFSDIARSIHQLTDGPHS